jgi:DNA-binding GntR family transcriptional regulator
VVVEGSADVLDEIAAQWDRRDRHVGAAYAVHDTVRHLIVSGVLRPGMRLGEEDYARQFSVSRTPVREAFLRLETEHLAERGTGRSLVVSGVTPEEILDIYAVRVAVEGLAARLAAASARPQDVANLRWLNGRLQDAASKVEPVELAAIDLQLHEAVCEAGRNTFLLELMSIVHDRLRRFRGTTFIDPQRPPQAIEEHERLIDAIEARDAELAEQVARHHRANAMEVQIRLLRESR